MEDSYIHQERDSNLRYLPGNDSRNDLKLERRVIDMAVVWSRRYNSCWSLEMMLVAWLSRRVYRQPRYTFHMRLVNITPGIDVVTQVRNSGRLLTQPPPAAALSHTPLALAQDPVAQFSGQIARIHLATYAHICRIRVHLVGMHLMGVHLIGHASHRRRSRGACIS
jgi:hypothetical protein